METNWQHYRKSEIGSAVENLDMLEQIIVHIPHQNEPFAYYAEDERLVELAWGERGERMAVLEWEAKLELDELDELDPSDWVDLAVQAIGEDLSSLEIIYTVPQLGIFLSQDTGHQIVKAQRAVLNLLRHGTGY